jgi:hypothetical protein
MKALRAAANMYIFLVILNPVLSMTESPFPKDTLFTVDDTNPGITYTNFSFYTHGGRFNNTTHESEHSQASFEFYFSGTAIEIIGEIQSWGGPARVYIDGELVANITYKGSSAVQQVVFSSCNLTDEEHHIKVASSGSGWIYLDAYRHASGVNATEPPVSPEDFTGIAESSNDVKLSWIDASGTNESYFLLERSLLGTDVFGPIAYPEANSLTHLDKGLRHNTSYIYRISAINGAGASDVKMDTVLTKKLTDGVVWVNDADEGFVMSNKWQPHMRDGRYMGTEHEVNSSGEYLKYSFLGTNIEMVAGLAPWGGTGNVFINGELISTVSFTNQDGIVVSVFTSDTLPLQRHTFFFLTGSGWNYFDALKHYTTGQEPDSLLQWPFAHVQDTLVSVFSGEPFTISGYGTDADGEIVKSEWEIVYSSSKATFYSDTKDANIDSLPVGRHHLRYKVTDNDGLEAYNMVRVTVIKKLNTNLHGAYSHNHPKINVYPTPGNGILKIDFNLPKNFTLEVFNIYNTIFIPETRLDAVNQYVLDLSHLKSGIYFIRISTDGYQETKKIIIAK